MDQKLKALKVVDLRQILAKAAVSAPAKATKADLIQRILASNDAINTYASLYAPKTQEYAPSQEWQTESPDPSTQPQLTPVSPSSPLSHHSSEPPIPPPSVAHEDLESERLKQRAARFDIPPPDLDPESEKRRQRAARFGIPVVEKNKHSSPQNLNKITIDDPEKLKQRAERFGTSVRDKAGPNEQVDAEELERRKKRAERFGA